jgi:hypothetical protein
MRQPFVAAAGGDDREARGARPVDQVADERGLIAIGQAVNDPASRARIASSGPQKASASTVTMTTCLRLRIAARA